MRNHSTRKLLMLVLDQGLGRGQFGSIPAAAECLNEQYTGAHSPDSNSDRGALICQQCALRGNDFEVAGNTTAVSIVSKIERTLRGLDSNVLLVAFIRKNSQRRQVVFHILKCGQD